MVEIVSASDAVISNAITRALGNKRSWDKTACGEGQAAAIIVRTLRELYGI